MNVDHFAADLLLRVTILLLVLLVLDWIFTRLNRPLIRSAAWHAGLIGLLMLPLLGFVISPTFQWKEPTLAILKAPAYLSKFAHSELISAHENAESLVTNANDSGETKSLPQTQLGGNVSLEQSTVVTSPSPAHASRLFDLAKTLIYFGLVFGYFISLIRFANSLLKTARLHRNSTPINESQTIQQFTVICNKMGIGANVKLASSDEIDVPMVIGTFRPRVLIPATMMLDDNLECILTHELTHVRRADPIWNLILRSTLLLYWFHPLIHLSRRRITEVREQICDNYCIHVIGRVAYGSALIDVAKHLVSSTHTNPPLELAAIRKTNLEQRIEFIRYSEGDSRYVASPRSRFTWLTISIVAALFVSAFTVFQIKAASSSNRIQTVSDSDDAEMWNFTDEQKKIFAELLKKGDDEIESVEEKVAMLTLIRDKNQENFEKLKSWSGHYKQVIEYSRADETHRNVVEGRFIIAPPLDSIRSEANKGECFIIGNDGTPQLQKNTYPNIGKWISTPEHVLSQTQISWPFIHRSSRMKTSETEQCLDPREWLGPNGWTTADNLTLLLEHASQNGFWDRASLSKTNTNSGLVYTLKLIYGFNQKNSTKKETLSTFSHSFSENAGYLLSAKSFDISRSHQTVRLVHEQQNGVYLPRRFFKIDQMQFANGDVANRSKETIELTHTKINQELSKVAFDIAQLEPSENDFLLDDLNGKTMKYQNGEFQEVDHESIQINGNFIQAWPIESRDWKCVQSVKTYQFRLVADQNGSLKEIIGSGGFRICDDGEPEAHFESAEKLVDKLKQAAQLTGTGIAQHFHFTLIPDPSLKQDEIERVQKELSFEMMFADGTMKTVPTISLSQSE